MADAVAQDFEELRPQLLRVAYGILGSLADAEDVVQEAWLRLARTDGSDKIVDLRAYLITTVSRLAYDLLGSARVRRESYEGPWLPEPLVEQADPAEQLALDESVAMALMIVLEELAPAERLAFVLHDVFGMGFSDIAEILGRNPDSVRQLASRARRRVHAAKPRAPASAEQRLEIVTAFASACAEGDLQALTRVLDPDVVWRSDGGGQVQASRRPQRGAQRVATALLALARRRGKPRQARIASVNGSPGLVLTDDEGLRTVIAVTIDTGRITALDFIRNPEKLLGYEPERGGVLLCSRPGAEFLLAVLSPVLIVRRRVPGALYPGSAEHEGLSCHLGA